MTTSKSKFGKTIEIMLWIAALGVLAENVVLFRQNRRLLEAITPQIPSGARLQMLSGLALDGHVEPVNLPSAGSKLLILTFSPGCPACLANQEGWMNLASMLKPKGVRVLWVSRDPFEVTREYCLKHGIPLIDVVADPPYRTYLQLGLARVPSTLLVGADGVVERVWTGRMDPTGWNSMFAYFGKLQDASSAAQDAFGAVKSGCGPELSGTPVKNCN